MFYRDSSDNGEKCEKIIEKKLDFLIAKWYNNLAVKRRRVGVDDAGGPPVPIPNTEVKPCGAEDSWLATACENREMPTPIKCPPNRVGICIFSQSVGA